MTTSSEEYITTLLTKSMDNLTPLESSGSIALCLVGDVGTGSELNIKHMCASIYVLLLSSTDLFICFVCFFCNKNGDEGSWVIE